MGDWHLVLLLLELGGLGRYSRCSFLVSENAHEDGSRRTDSLNGPISTQPPPTAGGMQFTGGLATLDMTLVQLWGSNTPLPLMLFSEPSKTGEFTGSNYMLSVND